MQFALLITAKLLTNMTILSSYYANTHELAFKFNEE